jgi:hypothetical protein
LQRRTKQQEIEPHAFVLAERVVVHPIRVHALGRVELPCGVHPALSQQAPERVPRRRLHYGIESPPDGVIDVKVGGDDIQIASEYDRLAGRIKSFRVSDETLEPQELVIEIG